LLTALEEYTGTVVFVSHDRYVIDRLATRVFEIEDGQLTVFPGNYEDYQWRKQGGPILPPTGGAAAEPLLPASTRLQPKPADKRVNPIRLRQMEERRHAIEQEVARLEAEIANHESELANYVSPEETRRLVGILEARRQNLGMLLAEWEDIAQAIEAHS